MSHERQIYGIHEEGPNGDALKFVDLAALDSENPIHVTYRVAVLDAAAQRRERGFGVAMLPHEEMLLLMDEMPKQAIVPDSEMPFLVNGLAFLEAEE